MPDLSQWSNEQLLSFIRTPQPVPVMGGQIGAPSAEIPNTYARLGDVSQVQTGRNAAAALAARGGLAGVAAGQGQVSAPAPGSFIVGDSFGGVQGAEQSATNSDRSYLLSMISALQRDREQSQREVESQRNAEYRNAALEASQDQSDTIHNEFLNKLNLDARRLSSNSADVDHLGATFANAIGQSGDELAKAEFAYSKAQQDMLATNALVTGLTSKKLITQSNGVFTGTPGYENTAASVSKAIAERSTELKNAAENLRLARAASQKVSATASAKGFVVNNGKLTDSYSGKGFNLPKVSTKATFTYIPRTGQYVPVQ